MTDRAKTGRPNKPPGEARTARIVIWVNPREQARFLINAADAGLTGSDFARAQLCHDGVNDNHRKTGGSDFELIDALTRIGMSLQLIAPIILQTGHHPNEFERLLDRLDAVLDRLLPS
ncbi:MAG: hypothetical protein KDJ29_14635 [Hyphomicrobiales bacterium]|nr:hypothetical protein [Hyphomicrobiales bacterium]